MDKAETQKYVQSLQEEIKSYKSMVDRLQRRNLENACEVTDMEEQIKSLQDEIKQLKSENEKLMNEVSELESELSVKENLLKIQNGLCGEMPINELSAQEISESYTFEELVDLCCRQQTEISRIEELEDRHQSDCITINQLNVALDIMTEKHQKLRGDDYLMELLKIILKQLQAIHAENMLIIATLTDRDMDDEYIQKMDKAFNDTWGGLNK